MKKPKKKSKAKKRSRTVMKTVQINLGPEQRAYVEELAEYACTDISMVCAVMMATGIFKAKRYDLPLYAENQALRAQLARCRNVMEANDPNNARDIFGPPQDTAPTTPEGSHVDSRGSEERPSDV
jgi:hypothetical protein